AGRGGVPRPLRDGGATRGAGAPRTGEVVPVPPGAPGTARRAGGALPARAGGAGPAGGPAGGVAGRVPGRADGGPRSPRRAAEPTGGGAAVAPAPLEGHDGRRATRGGSSCRGSGAPFAARVEPTPQTGA